MKGKRDKSGGSPLVTSASERRSSDRRQEDTEVSLDHRSNDDRRIMTETEFRAMNSWHSDYPSTLRDVVQDSTEEFLEDRLQDDRKNPCNMTETEFRSMRSWHSG